MSNLTQRLTEIGKYEIGAAEFDRLRNGDSLASYVLIFKLGALTMEGVALGGAVNLAYNGNYRDAGKIAAMVAGMEAIKYLYSRIEPKIRSLNDKLFDYMTTDK